MVRSPAVARINFSQDGNDIEKQFTTWTAVKFN